MRTSNNVWWRSLESWSAEIFLTAGILVLVSTVATGIEWLTAATGLTDGPLGVLAFLGMVLSYFGLLGLYPKLADGRSRLSRISVLLLLVPVAVIIVDLVSILVGFGPPFGLLIASIAFLLFALGIALFGVASLRTHGTATSIGVLLLAYAGGWAAFIGAGQIYGFPVSGGRLFGISVVMSVSLLGIGVRLRDDTQSAERPGGVTDSTT